MDLRKNKKPGRPRRRQLPRTDQPLNLMQLMRRRSRYRPYSVNNLSNRLTLNNFSFIENNSRNIARGTYRLNREDTYFRPLFSAINRLETRDVAVNIENPCCDLHFRNFANDNQDSSGNINELQGIHEAEVLEFDTNLQSLENEELAEESRNTNEIHENLQVLVESSKSQIPEDTENSGITTLAPSKSKESKSSKGSSTDYSGSSISYDEGGHKPNISATAFPQIPTHLKPFMYGQPQVNLHRISASCLTKESVDLDENQKVEASSSSVFSIENPQLFYDIESYKVHSETKLGSTETVANTKNSSSSSEIFKFKSDETERISSDYKLTNQESREEPSQTNSESQDYIMDNLSIVNDFNMISSMELPQSSTDTFDIPVTARFAFVDAHSNASTENDTSGSSLNNDENLAPTTASDNEAGGDGHHNNSDIHIEFTVTAIVNDINEEDTSNEGEENENQNNNEENEDHANEEI